MAQDQKSQFDQDLLNKKLFKLEYLFFMATFLTLSLQFHNSTNENFLKMQRKCEKSSQEKKIFQSKQLFIK